MKVLTFTAALALLISTSQAFAFIPKRYDSEAMVTKDYLYIKDVKEEFWRTKTDCSYSITKDSDVSIVHLGNNSGSSRIAQIKPDRSTLLVTIDGERQRCRVLEISQARM